MPILLRWTSSVIALLIAPAILAMEARLILPDGKPAAGCQVSIPGVSGSLRADRDGRITLPERAEPPVTLVIMGARGEIYPPVHVDEKTSGVLTIHLEPVLREIVTVTSGVAPNIEAPPAAGTTVIGREDLEERKPEHLADTLLRTPGVEIRGEGPAAVPVLRGLAGGRTLILHDDARITAERRAGASATFLDPFSLAAVEVSRGPGSVAYGSDALGGVIHARPREPVPGDSGLLYEATGSFGGRDHVSAGIEWTDDVPGGALLATVHAREADDGKAGGGVRIPNSSYRDRGGAIRFASPTSAGLFRAALMINEAFDVGAPAADADVTRTYYPEETSRRLTLGWFAAPTSVLSSLETHLALGTYDITTNRERLPVPGTTRQISSAEVDAKDASLRVAATKITNSGRMHTGVDIVSRFNLSATGLTHRFDSSDNATTVDREVSIDDAQKIDGGAFAIYNWNLTSKLTLSGGARVDAIRTKNSGGYFGSRSRSDTALSGHAAASLTPFSGLTASLQVASGYRDPSLSDRYFRGVSGRGFVVGNPDLEAERSLQFDGVVRWQRGQQSLELLGYHYRIRDLVERFRAGSDFNFRNRGRAEVKGVELEASTALVGGLSLRGAASFARGEALDDGAPLDDIAAPNLNLALHWASTRASAFLYGYFFAADKRPGPVEAERPGYAAIDAGFGWRFDDSLELRLNGRNLTDRRYAGSADANASLAPGRSISIGIGGRL